MIAYWSIRGLGQPCRLALVYAGVDFTDVRVDPGPGAPGSPGYKAMWMNQKADLSKSVNFVNLPFLLEEETGTKLVQTRAILRHIGRRYGLLGDDPDALDLIMDEASDLDDKVTGMCYGNFAAMQQWCREQLPAKLAMYAAHLEQHGWQFMAGNTVSVADFKLYETLSKLRLIEAEASVGTQTLASHAAMTAYVARMEALPALKAYLQSDSCIDRPLNNVHAQFK